MRKVVKKGYTGPRVTDTETFILKARWQHGDRYDYSKAVYITGETKVRIICEKHGEFYQRAAGHYSGKGCPKCGYEERANKQRRSYDEFVDLAISVHGGKYDYSKSKYKNVDQKVKIICRRHGEFYQTPHAHIFRGYGCVECSWENNADRCRKTQEDYIKECKEVHGNLYDYSLVEYTNTHGKVKIICPEHGVFEQVAKSHLNGHKCNMCATEDRGWTHTQPLYQSYDMESHIYVLELFDRIRSENFIKIGLSVDPDMRHRQIHNESGYETKILYKLKGKGKGLYATEREVLFRSNFVKHKPHITFGGQSECLQKGQEEEVIKFIESFYETWSSNNV